MTSNLTTTIRNMRVRPPTPQTPTYNSLFVVPTYNTTYTYDATCTKQTNNTHNTINTVTSNTSPASYTSQYASLHATMTPSVLSNYGYRYYSTDLGRWINRDPIHEIGSPAGRKAQEDIVILLYLQAIMKYVYVIEQQDHLSDSEFIAIMYSALDDLKLADRVTLGAPSVALNLGELNQLLFVRNNSINLWDYIGLESDACKKKKCDKSDPDPTDVIKDEIKNQVEKPFKDVVINAILRLLSGAKNIPPIPKTIGPATPVAIGTGVLVDGVKILAPKVKNLEDVMKDIDNEGACNGTATNWNGSY